MVTRSLQLKVIDFGCASSPKKFSLKTANEQVGTLGYQAPEIFNAGEIVEYTDKCDMWAAGCILYFMLYGYNPFSQNNAFQAL